LIRRTGHRVPCGSLCPVSGERFRFSYAPIRNSFPGLRRLCAQWAQGAARAGQCDYFGTGCVPADIPEALGLIAKPSARESPCKSPPSNIREFMVVPVNCYSDSHPEKQQPGRIWALLGIGGRRASRLKREYPGFGAGARPPEGIHKYHGGRFSYREVVIDDQKDGPHQWSAKGNRL